MKKQYKKLQFEIINVPSSTVMAASGPSDGGTNETPGIHGQSKVFLFDEELFGEE